MTTLRTLIDRSGNAEILDDLVHEVAEHKASIINNEGHGHDHQCDFIETSGNEIDDEKDMDDQVYDAASRIASSVNNEGIKDQIEFLNKYGWSDEKIKSRLIEDGLLSEDSDPLTETRYSLPDLN